MSAPVIVTLDSVHVDYADNVAAVRQGSAFLRRRANKNGLVGEFDQLLWHHRLGARCEVAGKLFLNPIKWHALAKDIGHLPDLGDFVDVKGRSRSDYDLVVQRDDEDDFAFLLITADRHPDYWIWGWLWGREAKQEQFWSDPKGARPAYFVSKDLLHSPDELRRTVSVHA
jgi:hypothetical protein